MYLPRMSHNTNICLLFHWITCLLQMFAREVFLCEWCVFLSLFLAVPYERSILPKVTAKIGSTAAGGSGGIGRDGGGNVPAMGLLWSQCINARYVCARYRSCLLGLPCGHPDHVDRSQLPAARDTVFAQDSSVKTPAPIFRTTDTFRPKVCARRARPVSFETAGVVEDRSTLIV